MTDEAFPDLDDLRIDPATLVKEGGRAVDLPTTARIAAKKKRRRAFVHADWDWVLRVKAAHPQALVVALAIKRRSDARRGTGPVIVGESDVDLPLYTLNRVLDALEPAGTIGLERHPGRLVGVWLLDRDGEGGGSPPWA